MQRVLPCLGLLAAMLQQDSALAEDKPAKKPDPKDKASLISLSVKAPANAIDPKKAKDKLLSAGVLVGYITELPDGSLKLRAPYKALLVNEEVAQTIAGLQTELVTLRVQLVQAIVNQDADGVASAQGEIARVQFEIVGNAGSLYSTEDREANFDIPWADMAAVRKWRLPVVFDKKGKPRKYSPDELKELKGEGKLPGFKAERDDLAIEQLVRVHLVRKRGGVPAASLVLILLEPPPSNEPQTPSEPN